MDDYLDRLIALRNVLRKNASRFHDIIEANGGSIEPAAVSSVCDLIEASMNTIDEMPLNCAGGNSAPKSLSTELNVLK
jgi:hypothetical protein